MIYVECKPDENLVQILTGLPKREIIHENGKYRLLAKLSKLQDTRAMVDEDPGANQPAYLNRMHLLHDLRDGSLKILLDRSTGNRVVVLCPKLEDWVIRAAQEADISLTHSRYNLPDTANALHRVINSDPRKLERLVEDLAQKNTPRVRSLSEGLLG